LEKRLPHRRVLKQAVEKAMATRGVQGVKVLVKGRLDGAEIARTATLARGKAPLHTLRADIDFAKATAFNTYGTVGVRVWIYKGEVLSEKSKSHR
jgi:small subunit ribosomal protein S3